MKKFIYIFFQQVISQPKVKCVINFIITSQDIFGPMEGNSYQLRPTSWKYSMIKHNTAQSRILTENKDLPTKFSPARNADPIGSNTSKSLVKSKIMSRSHDEIALRDLKDSSVSKDKTLQKKQTNETTGQMGNNIKAVQSEESINIKFESPIKRKQSRQSSNAYQNLDFIKDIKIEYLRFKERVLNQLKKQEEAIKQAIQQIMLIVSKSINSKTNHTIQTKTLSSPPQLMAVDNPVSFTKNLPKINIPSHMTVDTAKYRQSLVIDRVQLQSVMPKIKQRVNKMFDLMGQLKNQINEQSFHPQSTQQVNRIEVE